MVKTKEYIIDELTSRLGETPSDTDLEFLENVTDTLSDYISKASDTTDWKAKYGELDSNWRKRYTERFSEPTEIENKEMNDDVKTIEKYEDLFS